MNEKFFQIFECTVNYTGFSNHSAPLDAVPPSRNDNRQTAQIALKGSHLNSHVSRFVFSALSSWSHLPKWAEEEPNNRRGGSACTTLGGRRLLGNPKTPGDWGSLVALLMDGVKWRGEELGLKWLHSAADEPATTLWADSRNTGAINNCVWRIFRLLPG